MKHFLFDQDRVLGDLIDNWQSKSVDSKCEEIVIIGHPDTKFDGTQETIKLVLRIMRVEITRTIHPLSPVDKRPSAGECKMEKDKRCEYKRLDGCCTLDPIDNPRCDSLGDYNGENERVGGYERH